MRFAKKMFFLPFFVFAPVFVSAAVVQPPFAVNRPLEIAGIVKDAADLKIQSKPIVYEIPAYQRDGAKYVKYGVVCQREGEQNVIFADEGYLSQFVKTNVIDRPVLAKGRLVDGGRIAGLPKGIVFIIDSMHLED